jgi:hypothetical protein
MVIISVIVYDARYLVYSLYVVHGSLLVEVVNTRIVLYITLLHQR